LGKILFKIADELEIDLQSNDIGLQRVLREFMSL